MNVFSERHITIFAAGLSSIANLCFLLCFSRLQNSLLGYNVATANPSNLLIR